MVGEVLQCAGGTVKSQVFGRGAHYQPRAGQSPADQGRIVQDAYPYGHVVAFLDQVHHPVRQHHVQLYLRVLGQKAPPERRQMQVAEGVGHAHPQPSVGLAAA